MCKDTKGKPKLGLIPGSVLEAMATVREFGIKKYGDDLNWMSVPAHEFLHATARHLYKHFDGQVLDKESGLPHLHHALTSLALAIAVDKMEQEAFDDYLRDLESGALIDPESDEVMVCDIHPTHFPTQEMVGKCLHKELMQEPDYGSDT